MVMMTMTMAVVVVLLLRVCLWICEVCRREGETEAVVAPCAVG